MEVTSNGQIMETQNAKQEDNKVVTADVEEPQLVVESITEIVVDDGKKLSSDSSNSQEEEEEVKEESSPVKDSGIMEKEVVEAIELFVPLPQELSSTLEASIEKSKESDVTEVESKEIDESNTNEIASIVADGELNGTKETRLPSSTSDGTDGGVSEMVPGGVRVIELPASEDNDSLPAIVTDTVSEGIKEKLPSLGENDEVPSAFTDVVSKGIQEVKAAPEEFSTTVNKESVEIVDDSLKPSADATVVTGKDDFPESTGNPHVISVSQGTIQPTSWRSCCGLFEALRGSR